MFLIRQSFREDGDQILDVAKHLDTVNLPADAGHIAEILDLSERSFSGELEPAAREYLFVLEDVEAKRVVGTSMIHAQHGTRRAPHIYFQVLKDERYSETLDRYFVHQCLRLGYDYNGPTEIGGLILLPEYRGRGQGLGKLLSYTRFLFIAMHRQVFRDQVLSELLPPLPDGRSLLWECIGKHFTGLTYQEADLLSKNNKEFIRALFPHNLIHTCQFPAEVRDVIGVVGPDTVGVEKILRRIGFEYANTIDPFDGGPHYIANTDEITLVTGSRQAEVVDGEPDGDQWGIVASWDSEAPRFRAIAIHSGGINGTVALSATERQLLGVNVGDQVWRVVP